MNEAHIIAAILTAGQVARKSENELQPKDVVTLYELTLAEYFESTRPHRDAEHA